MEVTVWGAIILSIRAGRCWEHNSKATEIIITIIQWFFFFFEKDNLKKKAANCRPSRRKLTFSLPRISVNVSYPYFYYLWIKTTRKWKMSVLICFLRFTFVNELGVNSESYRIRNVIFNSRLNSSFITPVVTGDIDRQRLYLIFVIIALRFSRTWRIIRNNIYTPYGIQ